MTEETEIIMVCQVPECFAIGDEWLIGEHMYFYCPDHAAELGWCYSCEEYVGAGKLYAHGLCEGCYETAAWVDGG